MHARVVQVAADARLPPSTLSVDEDAKPKERRSVGAPPSLSAVEGEATVVRRQPEELPRRDAQDRVFGERRRSHITAEQLRGSLGTNDTNCDEPRSVQVPPKHVVEARRSHKERLAAFECMHEEWFRKQKACTVPRAYDGVRLKLPPTDDNMRDLIGSFTSPCAPPPLVAVFWALL